MSNSARTKRALKRSEIANERELRVHTRDYHQTIDNGLSNIWNWDHGRLNPVILETLMHTITLCCGRIKDKEKQDTLQLKMAQNRFMAGLLSTFIFSTYVSTGHVIFVPSISDAQKSSIIYIYPPRISFQVFQDLSVVLTAKKH